MSRDREIEELKDILRSIEYIEYEDPEEGFQVFCPVCGGTPERKRVLGFPPSYEYISGTGHDKKCKLALAIHGP
jgi:hypothetical protein